MRQFLGSRFGLRATTFCAAAAFGAILTSCGGGYGGGSSSTPATVNFSVMPTSITAGQSATLTWSTNGSGCTASGSWSGAKPSSGTQKVTPAAAGSYTYDLTCSGGGYGGSSNYSATLMVTAAAMGAAMTSGQTIPATTSDASGMAHLAIRPETGALSGTVKLSGLTASTVVIHEGFAGANGPALISLTPSASAGEWTVPSNTLLTTEQLSALSQGRLYVIAASSAHPRGEIRGQILGGNVVVTFSPLARAAQARGVGANAGGVIATTVDRSARTLSVHINSTGVDDADAAEVASAASGHLLAVLNKDSVEMGHWSTELVPVSDTELAGFESGNWYASIATAVDEGGALLGQIKPSRK